MTKSRAERKKNFIRIGALIIAGVMTVSILLAVIIH
jgi:hypothetical protein